MADAVDILRLFYQVMLDSNHINKALYRGTDKGFEASCPAGSLGTTVAVTRSATVLLIVVLVLQASVISVCRFLPSK